jgi:hypothetical protein
MNTREQTGSVIKFIINITSLRFVEHTLISCNFFLRHYYTFLFTQITKINYYLETRGTFTWEPDCCEQVRLVLPLSGRYATSSRCCRAPYITCMLKVVDRTTFKRSSMWKQTTHKSSSTSSNVSHMFRSGFKLIQHNGSRKYKAT